MKTPLPESDKQSPVRLGSALQESTAGESLSLPSGGVRPRSDGRPPFLVEEYGALDTRIMLATPIQIYIVDDEPAVRAAYARLVRSAKMEPLTFCNVEEFLSADVSDEKACIVSDVKMPGSSGLALPGLLDKAGRHLPVIFITAHDTPETRETAQRAGAAAFFRKPVDGQALLDAIEWALSKPPDHAAAPHEG